MVRKKRLPRRILPMNIVINETDSGDMADIGSLGLWSPADGEILIRRSQSWIGKNETLLHELFHALDDAMIEEGIIKRRASHEWIEHASVNLLLLLVQAGLWKGISKKSMTRHHRKILRNKRVVIYDSGKK